MYRIFFLILVLAGILVSVWFKEGYILGVAEDGLVFHNLTRYFHQAQHTWMEYPGLGSPALSLVAGKPTYFILSLLQREAGIPGFLIQASVLWVLLISSSIGIYFLLRELFPNLPAKFIFLSIVFYLINPISLFDVWNRFLLNYLFFFSLLPISSFFYIKGIRSKRYIWILPLNLSLLFFSYSFSSVAFIILFWIWIGMVTFFLILFEKNLKSAMFSIKYLLLTLLLFSILNSWWVLPLINLNLSGGLTPTSDHFLKQDNMSLLDALSKTVGSLKGIFQLVNLSFFSDDSLSWVRLYYSPILSFIQFSIVGLIIYLFIRRRKDSVVLFLGCLFLTSIFLAKGNNPPFGEIYSFLFKKILILQVFRNPFEKFGFLLSLCASLLLGPSIYELTKQKTIRYTRFIYPFFFVMILFYLGFPLYTSLAFTNKFPPTNDYSVGYKVKVPVYYKDVDNWLDIRGNNFRYIGFPIKDEGVTYNWEKGYAGVELAVSLFDSRGIFHSTSTPFFSQIIPEIERTMLSDEDFSKFANFVNAKYFILRYDMNYKLRNMTDPSIIEKKLIEREKKGEVKKVATFGKVSIWENLKWEDLTFYLAKRIIKTKNFDDAYDLTDIDILNGDVLIDEDGYSKVEKLINQKSDINPIIVYEKINSSRYILHLKNITKPVLLVFAELYNDGWNLTYPESQIEDNHLRVNKFANSWVIKKKGNFDVIVEFSSQRWMDIGEKISITGIIVMIPGILLYLFTYKRKKIIWFIGLYY